MLRKLCKSKFEYIYIHTCMYVKNVVITMACCDVLLLGPSMGRKWLAVAVHAWRSVGAEPGTRQRLCTASLTPYFGSGYTNTCGRSLQTPLEGPRDFEGLQCMRGRSHVENFKRSQESGISPMDADSTCQDSQPSVLFLGELQSDPQQSIGLKSPD